MKSTAATVLCFSLVGVFVYGSLAASLPPYDPCKFPILCRCTYGTIWSVDSNGCRRCSCKIKPQPHPAHCPLRKCGDISCPLGFELDDLGCPTCDCKTVVCPAIACDWDKLMQCPNGIEMSPNGCIGSCRCKRQL